MADQPLVSIITPCFNGEATLGRLLDSVLAQTHPNIELILVNDGSTDGTDAVVTRYRPSLEARLSAFTYVCQENRGLGGAINAGLQRVQGRYLCWPDADDYLEPESVALRMAVLEAQPEYAVVTSDAYFRPVTDLTVDLGRVSKGFTRNADGWQFEHLLRANSIFAAGTHMVCMRRFDETHPGRTIYAARRGQNWQMLLPLYYRYQRSFLDVPLYNYVVSPNSMSRSDDTLEKGLERALEHRDIVLKTLSGMDMKEEDRLHSERIVDEVYARRVMRVGGDFADPQVVLRGYRLLTEAHGVTPRDRAAVALARVGLLNNARTLKKAALRLRDSGPRRGADD